jgi:small subunit ribosomal protein S16
MLTIRLRRQGKKGQPSYRIVVADQKAPILGKYIEMLGHYNPFTKAVVLDKEKALEWLKKGAKPSNTVAKLMVKQDLKHQSIVIKKFRALSKAELEKQKAQEEKEKAEEAAKKEAAKAAFEQQVEAEKAEAPKEDKLQAMAEESIQEAKEEAAKAEKPAETSAEETKKDKPGGEDKQA